MVPLNGHGAFHSTGHPCCEKTWCHADLQGPTSTIPGVKASALAILLGSVVYGMAQQPLHQPDLAKQRAAMQKLSFLIGSWSGEAHVQRGPATLLQTENVEYKLGGLVLMIEGTGRAQADQQPSLQALGIITYDDATGAYHMRAWNDGRFLESDVQLLEDGKIWRWGFGVGDIRSSALLQIDKDGQWTEKTELIIGSQPPRKLMDLTVRRK